MAFFTPGKVLELQKWTEDPSLNGKIVGIIDKKNAKQQYPCYIFETQQMVNVTAAQLTYPDLDSNTKKKLQQLLTDVIDQKEQHKTNLAIKAEEEERRSLLAKQQKAEQRKIQAAMPNVLFDTEGTSISPQSISAPDSTQSTQIVVSAPPKDLYKMEDNDTQGIVIEDKESRVPDGYALVPVSTLNEVVKIKSQEEILQQREIELMQQQNELTLLQKQSEMDRKRKELELEQKQKELELDKRHLNAKEMDLDRQQRQSMMDNERKMEEEIRKKQKKKRKREKKYEEDMDDYDDEEDRKRKKKKKKKKKKKNNQSCLKCLCRPSALFVIIGLCGGAAGAYFYFLQDESFNIYAFIAWAGAIVAIVFGICCWCRG